MPEKITPHNSLLNNVLQAVCGSWFKCWVWASKGKTGGRTIPLHPEVSTALVTLQTWRGDAVGPDRPIIFSERGGGLSPATVRLWFHRLYTSLKMDGCASHSGRRTFITRAARKVSQVGGSLARCAGARRPYESRDDTTLHRG
jgi:hypothetical protein